MIRIKRGKKSWVQVNSTVKDILYIVGMFSFIFVWYSTLVGVLIIAQ